MTLGERLLQYRKKINMSQDQLAEKVGVTRQTISKWETDQSTPDFNKIEPLCNIFGITTDELIKGKVTTPNSKINENKSNYLAKRNKKKAIVLSVSIFLYCIATFGLPYMTEVLKYEDAHAVMIWATLCTIATVIIIYFFCAYPEDKIDENQETEKVHEVNNSIAEKKENLTETKVIEIIALIFLIVYLVVSFITMAWHLTWILWVVFACIEAIVKLIFDLRSEKNEK